jgi:PPOX class probable F420-dependent enzyme
MASNQSDSTLARRPVPLYNRFRYPRAHLYGGCAAASNSVLALCDAKYLLLESERADGTWVGTPMWCAVVDDTVFLRTAAQAAKVRRISRRPIVKVATCTVFGTPRYDYIECTARIVPREGEAQAEDALRRRYGLPRRLINAFTPNRHVYLELTPLDRKRLPIPVDRAPQLQLRVIRGGGVEPSKAPPDAA